MGSDAGGTQPYNPKNLLADTKTCACSPLARWARSDIDTSSIERLRLRVRRRRLILRFIHRR